MRWEPGVNELIRKGAILTTRINDILKYYPEFNKKFKKIRIRKYNSNYGKIINILEEGEKSMQELIILSDMELSEIFETVTKMEIENIISKNYLGKYVLVNI